MSDPTGASGRRIGAWGIVAILLAALVVALVVWWVLQPRAAEPRPAVLETLAPLPAPQARALVAPASGRAEDGQWTMPPGDYAATRFSALDQINVANVGRLRPVFTFDTGVNRGQEAAPIVVGTTMYVVTPFPNIVYALDLTRPDHPVKWAFRPRPLQRAQGVACCDVVNRGAVFSGGRLFFNTLDGQTIALDAETGREIWRTRLANINIGETITMAPLVADGRVLVGSSGGEFGVRGWLAALDAGSGALVWKAWSTGPDTDVLIGPNFHPFYASARGRNLGVTSWQPEGWRIGGGNPWGWISYDPQTHLVFYGTGNPGPWNPDQRPGDNLWTAGVFARDIRTGEARWFYQSSPHDLFDHDDVNESVLLDMPVRGRIRHVLVRAGRTGFMYVMDRESGELLSADPYAFVNSISGIDLATGRPSFAADKMPQQGRVTRNICPAAPGGKDWNPSTFSPRTGLLYVPHLNLCMDEGHSEANYIAGTPYLGADARMYAGPGGNRGMLTAWDPVARRPVWRIREDLPVWSGALATGGDLVFYGTMDGLFKAVDARSGRLLWQFRMNSGTIGQPVSFRGPDGRQYIAILAGVGGWSGAIVSGALDKGDPTSALGFVNAVRDLPARTDAGGRLYVFALPR
ncbi:MAG: PQQ-dependent dehydrogenase, methanol/ethanol family [Alphaproteobacteria bacterium]|nr:MAG: PQQ-dependent dehydrogenase, methanol/ethanol family [Alphaproteobacteria bacterium]